MRGTITRFTVRARTAATRSSGRYAACRGTARNEWANAPQHGGEIFSVDKLHHDCGRFTLWCNVKDGGDIRVRNYRCGAALGAETISGCIRCCERCAKHLDRHVATERLIRCAED